MKITTAIRTTVRAIIADSREYDAASVQITRSGDVTALKDADKTFGGNDPVRYLVARVDEMVTADGQRQEGW